MAGGKRGGRAGREEGSATLFAFQTGSPVAGLYVSDAHGAVLYESRPLPADPGAPDVGVTMLDGRPMLVVTRDVRRAGQFAGRVTALVDLAEMPGVLRRDRSRHRDRIGLLRDDGMMLARRPPTAGSVGRKYPELIRARDVHATREDKQALMTSPVDGQPRFFALTEVRGFPFVLMATRDAGAALAGWREIAIHAGVRTALLDLLGALLLVALVRQLARADAADQAVRGGAGGAPRFDGRHGVCAQCERRHHLLEPRRRGDLRLERRGGHGTPLARAPQDECSLRRSTRSTPELVERTGHWEGELVHTRRDGTTLMVASRWALRRDDDGRPSAVLETNNDITARKGAEAAKARLEGELRRSQKMESLGTLAGGIAHDFNNLLGAILGYGELAQRKAGESGPLREQLDQVMQAGNRGKRLVEQILAPRSAAAGSASAFRCTCSRSSRRRSICSRRRCRPRFGSRRCCAAAMRPWPATPRSSTR